MTNPVLLNALAHDAKLVLSFTTPTKYRDPSDPLSLFFKSALLIPQVSTNAFHSTNLFIFFSSLCSYQ